MKLTIEVADRVDKALARFFPEAGRRQLSALFDAGAVRVNGKRARKGDRVTIGDTVELARQPVHGDALRPTPDPDVPLTILVERGELVVVAKPAGIPSQPVVARAGRQVRLRISSVGSLVIGTTPGWSGNFVQISSPRISAVRAAWSTRCFGIWTASSAGLIAPVAESSSRSRIARATRKLSAITPEPSPECTPSVNSDTSSVPITRPRSDVVHHSWS